METLKTDRLLLREWRLSDSKDLFEYAKSDLVGPHAGWPPHPEESYSLEIIKSFIYEGGVYAIEHIEDQKVIGGIGLHKRKPSDDYAGLEQRELGYVLNPKYWGCGYVPEAVKRLIEYGFEDLGLELIWCGHYSDNIKSKRVIEKTGFEFKFIKDETLRLLNDRKVQTHFYWIDRNTYEKMNLREADSEGEIDR